MWRSLRHTGAWGALVENNGLDRRIWPMWESLTDRPLTSFVLVNLRC